MKNIVLPVDFSDTTDVLIDGAVDFAKEVMGKICLIHVAPADIGFAIGDMGFQYFPAIEENEIAEELREYMAQLGFKTVDEMVGRSDLLEPKDDVKSIDLSKILNKNNNIIKIID